MAQSSDIEWTNATWNPVTGCNEISAGCDHCYAKRFSERFRGVPGHAFESGFDLTLRPERLTVPLHWRKPRMIFVNSMSDLFHKDIPIAFIDQVFDTMEAADWHTFQILTKRSSLMMRYVNRRYHTRPGPPHIWLGVSVENRRALSRIGHLQSTKAAIRFVSAEPLLEDLSYIYLGGLHWVIAGGESGPGRRPINADWMRHLRDQCARSGVAFFCKQMDKVRPIPPDLMVRQFPAVVRGGVLAEVSHG